MLIASRVVGKVGIGGLIGMNRLLRRDFIRLGGMGLAALGLSPRARGAGAEGFPDAELLCRVFARADLYSRPTADSTFMGSAYDDAVLEVYREVVGRGSYYNHCWYETPYGFIWAPEAQLVRNRPNQIMESVPDGGIWTEVTVPYVEGRVSPDPWASTWYRLYYAMILNVDARAETSDGETWYRVHDENDVVMYAPGWAFRPIAAEEMLPISPEVQDKRIVINLNRQDLSAFENGIEVYYCRISSGIKDNNGEWSTPPGSDAIWWKMVSRHMSGGTLFAGYDLPGVGWTAVFYEDGHAIHATYWHNYFGRADSHGCVNAKPEDAKWLFRWTSPSVDYRPGNVTMYWPDQGTRVYIEE
jgi:hypothetical protein